MTLPRRDTQYHTYGEYLTWPDDRREELIDGVAYIKEPPAPTPQPSRFDSQPRAAGGSDRSIENRASRPCTLGTLMHA